MAMTRHLLCRLGWHSFRYVCRWTAILEGWFWLKVPRNSKPERYGWMRMGHICRHCGKRARL